MRPERRNNPLSYNPCFRDELEVRVTFVTNRLGKHRLTARVVELDAELSVR
jgi:hypothetical protein